MAHPLFPGVGHTLSNHHKERDNSMTTFVRTYEQLQEDLAHLQTHIEAHRQEFEQRGIIDDLRALSSRAEARLDCHGLFPPDPWEDRLKTAYDLMSRAWMRIQSRAISGEELPLMVELTSQEH